MTTGGQLDAHRVQRLLQELSDRLACAGKPAQLFVVGGAAMALAYDADRLTRDDRDLEDAALLFNRLGYVTAQECIDLLIDTCPIDQLLPRHRYIAEDVVGRARARRDECDTPRP